MADLDDLGEIKNTKKFSLNKKWKTIGLIIGIAVIALIAYFLFSGKLPFP